VNRRQTYNSWETLSFSAKAEEKGFVSASIRGTSTEPTKFDDFSIQLKSPHSWSQLLAASPFFVLWFCGKCFIFEK
jgi:hypothetical protein